MKKRKERAKRGFIANFWLKHRVISILILLFLILLIIIGGFQLFNYTKFVLGFDLTLRLGADKNDLTLSNGESSQIEFSIDKISNILCNTKCYYKFTDLSRNITLADNSFTPIQAVTKKISQEISAPEQGEGQEIYAFDLTCKNQATVLCKTEGINISRRTIITLEYNLSEEQLNIKKGAEEQLYSAQALFSQVNNTLQTIIPQILMNKSFLVSQEDYALLNDTLENLSVILAENLPLWIRQDYNNIKIGSLNSTLNQLKTNQDNFNKNFNYSLFTYNFMIDNLSSIAQNLENIKNLSLNQSQADRLESIILDFNQKILLFDKKTSLDGKKAVFNSINLINISEFENQSTNFSTNFSKTNLLNLTEIKINFNLVNNSLNITLPETKKICCLDNSCQYCEVQKKYPIILLHGHNFNQDISADNIINAFGEIQNRLESIGYLNAGELYLYEPTRANSGILGTIIKPIAVRPSYYFDFLEKPQGYKSIQIQSENIDNYAIRLRDIIENIKYETQSPKVIIITHSMGGLVVRRYIQIFGKESLDRIILIDSPNAGITGTISKYCSTFGATSECSDMDSESLFINKLNREYIDMPKTYNIVGTGCKMNEGDGDGVVLVNSSILKETENVKNFFVNGTCSGISLFHNNILDINKYQEVFAIIENALIEDNNSNQSI